MKVFSAKNILPMVERCWPHNPENYQWVYECDGLTQQECRELGYEVMDEWLVENNTEWNRITGKTQPAYVAD